MLLIIEMFKNVKFTNPPYVKDNITLIRLKGSRTNLGLKSYAVYDKLL